jgi:hypothetical protein
MILLLHFRQELIYLNSFASKQVFARYLGPLLAYFSLVAGSGSCWKSEHFVIVNVLLLWSCFILILLPLAAISL